MQLENARFGQGEYTPEVLDVKLKVRRVLELEQDYGKMQRQRRRTGRAGRFELPPPQASALPRLRHVPTRTQPSGGLGNNPTRWYSSFSWRLMAAKPACG